MGVRHALIFNVDGPRSLYTLRYDIMEYSALTDDIRSLLANKTL